MEKLSYLNRPRLLVLKDWLDAQICTKIRSEIDLLTDYESKIVSQNLSLEVEKKVQKTSEIFISEPTSLLVQCRLIDLKPALEKFFSLELTELQKPRFLPYDLEYFNVGYTDSETEIEFSNCIKHPHVSIIIFLNNQTEQLDKNSCNKACLTFPKFFSDSHGADYDLSVRVESGLFVAFCSDIPYAVQPVISGEQYTIVSHLF